MIGVEFENSLYMRIEGSLLIRKKRKEEINQVFSARSGQQWILSKGRNQGGAKKRKSAKNRRAKKIRYSMASVLARIFAVRQDPKSTPEANTLEK